ncbi:MULTISPECIES: hypothetical protein [unclassified Paenibacillus]|uniref:hypothetical protein n=1 Tax=unclassified Paenibacillus TaxID=185978 RepID=UPI00362E11EE
MKKAWHYVTAGTLMFSLTLGLVGGASAEEAAGNFTKVQATEAASVTTSLPNGNQKSMFMYRMGHSGLLQSEANERKYLQLLAKAYTPGDEAAWLAAFDGRKKVEEQFPKMAATRAFKMTNAVSIQKLDKDAVPSLTEGVENGTVTMSPVEGEEGKKLFTIRVNKTTNAEGVEGAPGSIFPLEAVVSDDIINAKESEAPPELKLQTDFAKAVEADDSAAIKELLPKLLIDYKEKTAEMTKALEQIKEKQQEKQKQESQK